MLFSLPSLLFAAAGLASTAAAASLQQVTNFGNNPSGAQMFIYVRSLFPSPVLPPRFLP